MIDTTELEGNVTLIQELLGVVFPDSFKQYVLQQSNPKIDLQFSFELDSVYGATAFFREIRPDLKPQYVVVNFEDEFAVCLDLEAGDKHDAPVVSICLEKQTAPEQLSDSFKSFGGSNCYIKGNPEGFEEADFQHGLKQLDHRMRELTYDYDHKKGGRLPRSHVWRPYRFCIQDVIFGVTVIRHDKMYNRLEVDVFLTAWIDEYEKESGCLALGLIILSDAYKSGGSMEIKFTENVENGKVPKELVDLAKKKGVFLNKDNADHGGISPHDAKKLYMALTGLNTKTVNKISELDKLGKLSSASVCYAIHHGAWTKEELEVILFMGVAPESILTGSCPVELWHLYLQDLQIGRTALMATYLERQLRTRIHRPSLSVDETDNGEIIELEDDEREVEVEFIAEICGKNYVLGSSEEENVPVPWLEHGLDEILLDQKKKLTVLLRARDVDGLRCNLGNDLQKATSRLCDNYDGQVCIMVPADFRRLENEERLGFAATAKKSGVGIIICPEFVLQLDQAVGQKFESVKIMRS